MANTYGNPEGMAAPLGFYSHGVVIPPGARVLVSAGQVGVARDSTVPKGFAAQAENTWYNLTLILQDNKMTVNDLVKINHFLTDAANIQTYRGIFTKYLGRVRPASTLLIVAGLARPELLLEVEIVAAQ